MCFHFGKICVFSFHIFSASFFGFFCLLIIIIISVRMFLSVRSSCWTQLLRLRQVSATKHFFSTTPTEDITVIKNDQPPPPSSSSDLSAGPYSQADVLQPVDFKLPPLELKNINTDITPVREAWIENMSTPHSIKLGILPLHPEIFSAFPRPDYIQENHKWQTLYKHVDWRCMKTRAELKGTTKKPWPQKGMGRARHGDRLAPQFKNGGWACGPRGPRTYFYMLHWPKRVNGLISTLSCKFAQNDIHIVDSFQSFPLDGTTAHLEELCEERGWGPSVLFVDKMPLEDAPQATKATHFYQATQSVTHINVLPMYGLNVFSMLKHETLVLTVDALKDIESKLLNQLRRIDLQNVMAKSKPYGISRL